jgi:hypothetical protein
MTETPEPIPPIWREKFNQAIDALDNWTSGTETIFIIEGERFTVGGVCNRVMRYSGETPECEYETVLKMVEEFEGSNEAPTYKCDRPQDNSYAAVAQCLIQLYSARKAHIEEKERRIKDDEF